MNARSAKASPCARKQGARGQVSDATSAFEFFVRAKIGLAATGVNLIVIASERARWVSGAWNIIPA